MRFQAIRIRIAVLVLVVATGPDVFSEVVTLRGGTILEGTVTEVADLGLQVDLASGGGVFVLDEDVVSREEGWAASNFTGYLEGEVEGLQTRSRIYRHPETGTVVSLVGAVHVGDPAYYEELQRMLDAHEVVLFEGVRGLDSGEIEFIARLQIELKDFLGLGFQKDHLDYARPNWVNADMTWEEMRRELEARNQELIPNMEAIRRMTPMITKMLETQMKSLEKSPGARALVQDSAKRILGRMLASSERLFKMLGIYDEKQRNDVLISLRNDRAFEALEKSLAEGKRSVAVFYGAAHLPDLERRLTEELGFRPVGDRWLLAWRVENEPR
jgi:hypothetical protein